MTEEDSLSGGVTKAQIESKSDMLEKLVETDVGEEYVEYIGISLGRSHQLSARRDHETEELKWFLRMLEKTFIAIHPPKNSIWTGDVREACLNDTREPLTDKELFEIRQITQIAISNATKGRDAKLLEELSKQTRVQKQEISDDRGEPDDSSGGSMFSSIFG
jgi:signal recognition particle GTPase